MALAISNIPVLNGAVAADFVERAENAEHHRGSIDFGTKRREYNTFEQHNAARVLKLREAGWPV